MYRTSLIPVAIAMVLALASCGGGGSSTRSTNVAEKTVRSQESRQVATKDLKTSDGSACQARLGNFVARMKDLRQSLLAGLSYDEYVLRVRAIRDAYEAVPVDQLGAACVTGPAADAEDAFNEYLRAANAWGECAATAGCAASDVEAKLQHRWKLASKSLDAAEKQT
ncbi:MAG: hypothetical protein JST59_08610 [Actinobacteria bacterium]|nr:hypothetical protein [Actinomycetota bacterium]